MRGLVPGGYNDRVEAWIEECRWFLISGAGNEFFPGLPECNPFPSLLSAP